MLKKIAVIRPDTGLETILNKLNVDIIYTKCNPLLQKKLADHPDMNMCLIANDRLVINTFQHSVAEMLKTLRPQLKIVLTDLPNSADYPKDVSLNAVFISNKILALKSSLSPEVLNIAQKEGYEIINCRQGYTHCSVLKISEKAAITGDRGLYSIIRSMGVDTLLVNNDRILLDGYGNGFIGGCGFMLDENRLLLNGSLKFHSDGEAITEFCNHHGVLIIEADEKPLTDIGGGFVF